MDNVEKSERLMEAASAILHAAPGHQLNIVVLNKALFYLDLISLRDTGQPLTFNPYVALEAGPVVAKYDRKLIGEMSRRGLGHQQKSATGAKPVILDNPIIRFKYLSNFHLAKAKEVASTFAKRPSQQASDYSHENPGWKLAWAEGQRVGKKCPINMLIAMQQIVDQDPWMKEPFKDGEALAAADADEGEEW